MTNEEINARLDMVERMIAKERDTKTLASLNQLYMRLIDAQVASDMNEPPKKAVPSKRR